MDFTFLIQGIIIGFSIAAPVGPIGVLCIRQSIKNGNISGFVTGMGAATADAFYGVIAAFGLTIISSFLVKQRIWLQIIGIVFLFYFGIKIFSERSQEKIVAEIERNNLLRDYFSGFFLTLSNPMTILSFLAVFASLGLGQTPSINGSASFLVLGVLIGSTLWWLILSSITGIFHEKIQPKTLRVINKISGVIILLFAITILIITIKSIS